MGESESNKKQDKGKRRFSQEQYDMLKRCSEKKDMTEWNKWRQEHRGTTVELEGGDLSHMYLKGAKLGWGLPKDPKRHVIRLGYFGKVYLKGAGFTASNLQDASFGLADLEDASFVDARLEGAHFEKCNLQKASFVHATVDGSSLFWECEVTKYRRKGDFTDFLGVALDTARIDPAMKQLLQYNIRRMNWDKWYWGEKAKKPFGKVETKTERWMRIGLVVGRLVVTFPIRWFWWMSDYGRSTGWVIAWFFILAFLFAAVYMNWGYWRPPGIVSNLIVQPEVGEAVLHYFGRALIRPVYFSIVTMTTLGFGDMYANKGSIAGHVILAVQVILGYVLLGALITRFAVLFTAGGPAGKFVESGRGPD